MDNPRREALEAKYAHLPLWEQRIWIARGMERQRIPNTLRQAVYDRDGRACVECHATERLSLDHIRPLSAGGLDTFENFQTLCVSCNARKGCDL